MQVVAFLVEHKDLLSCISSHNAAHFVDPEHHPVITCPSTSTMREALSSMLQHKVTGLPVVDSESGALLANVSLTDVRRVVDCRSEAELEVVLSTTVLDYLARGGAPMPLTVQPTDNLLTAVELVVASKMCVPLPLLPLAPLSVPCEPLLSPPFLQAPRVCCGRCAPRGRDHTQQHLACRQPPLGEG